MRERLSDTGKMVVVASEADRKALQAMRMAQQGAAVDADARCEVGKQLPPNSLLKVSKVDGGRERYLALELFDLGKGRQQASVTVPWDEKNAARDAVADLLGKLQRTGTLVVSASVDGA